VARSKRLEQIKKQIREAEQAGRLDQAMLLIQELGELRERLQG
jgi:hypothetical protein